MKFHIDLLKREVYKAYSENLELLRLQIEERMKTCENLIVFVDEIQKIPALLDTVHDMTIFDLTH